MATTAKLTLEQFLKLPETKPYSEYIDGKVVQKPMPTYAHMVIHRLLSVVFTLYLRAHPIGDAGPELRCVFTPQGRRVARVPDFVFVSWERLGGTRGDQPLRGAPDLAVEILSPDDRMIDVEAQVAFYLAHGVRLVWVINPQARTVTVRPSPSTAHILGENDPLDGGDVLPGFSVPVRDILPPSDPPPA